ncbi:MAG: efflux RND transporter periplasmic adaptor subunit [Gammaproteobacteria bacterium]|nr:efflux RND transporter periplasmic adaptor subunit [Gammaproteobacteria bacterium]
MALSGARNGIWALLVLIIGGAAAYGVLVGKPEPAPEEIDVAPMPSVDVVVAAPVERSLSVVTQGTVRPLRQVRLMSQVSGRVQSVSDGFSQGSFFSADQELIKVEDVDYRLQIARAESQVAASRQVLAEEKGRALQARREWRDLGTAQANALFLREPQIAAAEAALRAAEADLQAARLDLQRTSISVPFNGRISEKHVDAGQFVSAGTHLATVYATDAVEIRLPLTGRQVALLDLPLTYDDTEAADFSGVPVVIQARFANRLWEWQGQIVRTDASIDESSRVVYAVAEVHKPFARDSQEGRPPLAPGLFVSATISGRAIPDVVELPRSALRSDRSVLVVNAVDRTQRKEVHVLDSNAQTVWVQGLSPSDRVVTGHSAALTAGMQVVVRNSPELAGSP